MHGHVGQHRGRLQAGGEEQAGADGGVRHHPQVEGLGQAADLHELGHAGVRHLGLDDGHGAALEARQRLVDAVPLLAQRHRHARLRAHARLALQVLGGAGGLDEQRVVRGQALAERERLRGVELPVQVHHQPRLRAEGGAQRGHLLGDALVRDDGGELDGIVAARVQRLGHAHALGQRGPGQARGIGRDARVPPPAQQLRQRQAGQAAVQVPHGDVQRGQRVAPEPARAVAHAHEVVQVFMDDRGLARVAPEQLRAEHVGDDLGDGARGDDAVGLAPADAAVAGGDADDDRAVHRRVEGAVAGAHDVAARHGPVPGRGRAEVGHVTRQRDDVGVDGGDAGGGHRLRGVAARGRDRVVAQRAQPCVRAEGVEARARASTGSARTVGGSARTEGGSARTEGGSARTGVGSA